LVSEFQEKLAQNFKQVDANTMLNSGIKSAFDNGVKNLSSKNNVELLAQGNKNSEGFKGSAHVFKTSAENFLNQDYLEEEVFGPSTITITADSKEELLASAKKMKGHLTASLFATEEDLENYIDLIEILEQKVGRIMINNFPTGVEVCHSMVHGGPFPATTNSRSTSVGTGAITRFTRPVCYQSFPEHLLPDELKKENPLGIIRIFNGEYKK